MNFVWIETSKFCATHKRADWQILFIPLLLSLYSSPYIPLGLGYSAAALLSALWLLLLLLLPSIVRVSVFVIRFTCRFRGNLIWCVFFFLCCSCHSLFSFFHFAIIVNCSREFVQLKRNAKSEMCSKHLIFLMCVEWLYSFVSFCLFAKFIYSFVFNCFFVVKIA